MYNINDINNLLQYNEIIFGPFLGTYEIELSRWSPFIRYFSKLYNGKIIISTRPDRVGLYNGITKYIDTFSFEGDNTKYEQKYFYCENLQQEILEINRPKWNYTYCLWSLDICQTK